MVDGVRVHTCPKVGYDAIVRALEPLKPSVHCPEEEGPEYRFMPVRHPLSRIVSCWYYFCKSGHPERLTGSPGMGELGYYDQMPLSEFFNICLRKHDGNRHTRKQILAAGPHEIEGLVPLENLTAAWELVRRINSRIKPIGHTHKTEHDNWETYYTEDMTSEGEVVFSDDLALYKKAKANWPRLSETLTSNERLA